MERCVLAAGEELLSQLFTDSKRSNSCYSVISIHSKSVIFPESVREESDSMGTVPLESAF